MCATCMLDIPFLPSSIPLHLPINSSLGAHALDLHDKIAVSSNMPPKYPPPTAHSS